MLSFLYTVSVLVHLGVLTITAIDYTTRLEKEGYESTGKKKTFSKNLVSMFITFFLIFCPGINLLSALGAVFFREDLYEKKKKDLFNSGEIDYSKEAIFAGMDSALSKVSAEIQEKNKASFDNEIVADEKISKWVDEQVEKMAQPIDEEKVFGNGYAKRK